MVVTAIVAGVSGAVMQMFLSVGRVNFDTTAKLQINRDVRSFTNQLSRSARSAREFRIYAGIDDLTVRASGQSGDLLVLVWADPEPIETATDGEEYDWYYRRIIAFARTVDDVSNNTGPVMRYERTYAAPSGGTGGTSALNNTVRGLTEELLKNTDGLTEVREVIQLTRGLAEERLFFYSRMGRSITVNGEIFHGNSIRRVTNTYNFTVTPRG